MHLEGSILFLFGGGWGVIGGFFVCFLEGGTRRPLHETKICQIH